MKKIDMTGIEETREFRRPSAGPYMCIITDVEDHPKEQYLEVEYDIADGEFNGYYADMRDRGFQWAGKYRKYYTEKSKPFFKRFCSAVSKSNGNYVFDAGDVNCEEKTLISKYIGIVFQEVEYDANDGSVKTRLEVFKEFPIDKIADQKTPEPKKKPRTAPANSANSVFVAPGIDEELPFA